MADQQGPDVKFPDPQELAEAMSNIAQRSQNLVSEFLSRNADPGTGHADPLNIGSAFFEMTTRLMADPAKLWEAQMALWQDYMTLWQNTARRMMGEDVAPVAEPERGDRRFKDEAWEESEVFDFIKQSYLLTARWVQDVVNDVEGMDDKTAQKVDFYTRQFVDAMAPSNFVMTNPQVLRETAESGGENLVRGLNNLLEDLERGKGNLRIKMTDYEAFTVGENIAVTPGKVVYQNELMQVIQYSPQTEQVAKRPLLVVPPWINKYYILDLRPENSFLRHAVEQGNTVFTISWVNPDERLAQKGFEDYMTQGVLEAMDAVRQATGEDDVNMVGYCLGGTLMGCTLSYLAQKGEADRVASATFLTSLLDFHRAGELTVFIDEQQVEALEDRMRRKGYLEGSDMASTFNMLRANDLIWSFVVNNYLLGKEPFPFDLLYWNSDPTRLPAAMHSFYLRKMYLENKLVEPGGIELAGVPIDLSKVKTPAYFLSTREDHISPWKATYDGTRFLGGPVRFVLAASGHIAGVVNPPAKNKYCHWVRTGGGRLPRDPDTWFEGTTEVQGSWWPDWQKWLGKYANGRVAARAPGGGRLTPIEDAPGSYVKMTAE